MAAKYPAALVALGDLGGLLAGIPNSTAVLSGAHTDAVATITLTAAPPATWPTKGWVVIDNEAILYTGKGATTLTGCTRGQLDTTAAAHSDAATVRLGLTKGTINQVLEELVALEATGAGGKGADIASAATITLGSDGRYFAITGTTTITALSARVAGAIVVLRFDGALTLTHNATSLILQGSTNLTTAAGDVLAFVSEGSGNWRELSRRLAAAASGAYNEAVRAVATAAQTTTSSVALTLAFAAADTFDSGTLHDTVTNNSRLTAAVAGKYQVTALVQWVSNASGGNHIVYFYKNGVFVSEIGWHKAASVTMKQFHTDLIALAAGDYVEVRVLQDTGANEDVGTAQFSMVKVAA